MRAPAAEQLHAGVQLSDPDQHPWPDRDPPPRLVVVTQGDLVASAPAM